jgi:hypothetical protein
MSDLFKEIIPSILQSGKKTVSAENESDNVPYVVNKALSFHYDCIFQANQMNVLPNTDRLMHYDYLLGSVRKYKRSFQPWQKLKPSEDMSIVKEYYRCSNEKAKDILNVLSRDQIDTLKKRLYKGGIAKPSRK